MGLLDYVIHRTPERQYAMKREIMAGKIPPWIANRAKSQGYIIQVILSTPPWVDRYELVRIQERARCITEMSGVPQHICHQIPLRHPLVCGLTVPWNLEIESARKNQADSNHWNNDRQLALF